MIPKDSYPEFIGAFRQSLDDSSDKLNRSTPDEVQLTTLVERFRGSCVANPKNLEKNLGNDLRGLASQADESSKNQQLFLKVLARLMPFITNDSDFILFIDKYLNLWNSDDLASGLQLLISSLLRSAMLLEGSQPFDAKLLQICSKHAFLTLVKVVRKYCDLTSLKPENTNTLYLKYGLLKLISEYASKYPESLYQYISTELKKKPNSHSTLGILSILSSVAENASIKSLQTPLLDNIINCALSADSIETIDAAVSAICAWIPYYCTNLSAYLPSLFICLAKRLCWSEKCKAFVKEHALQAGASVTSCIRLILRMDPTLTFGLRLQTLLYGLFPLNLISFCTNPTLYLDSDRHKKSYSKVVGGDTKLFIQLAGITLRRYTLHNHFMIFTSFKQELTSPNRVNLHLQSFEVAPFCFDFDSMSIDNNDSGSDTESSLHKKVLSVPNIRFRVPDFSGGLKPCSSLTSNDEGDDTSGSNRTSRSKREKSSVTTSSDPLFSLRSPPHISPIVAEGIETVNKNSIVDSLSTGSSSFGKSMENSKMVNIPRKLSSLENELQFIRNEREAAIDKYKQTNRHLLQVLSIQNQAKSLKIDNDHLTKEIDELTRALELKEQKETVNDDESSKLLKTVMDMNKNLQKNFDDLQLKQREDGKLATERSIEIKQYRDQMGSLTNSITRSEEAIVKLKKEFHNKEETNIKELDEREETIKALKTKLQAVEHDLSMARQIKMDQEPDHDEDSKDQQRLDLFQNCMKHYQKVIVDYRNRIEGLEAEINKKSLEDYSRVKSS